MPELLLDASYHKLRVDNNWFIRAIPCTKIIGLHNSPIHPIFLNLFLLSGNEAALQELISSIPNSKIIYPSDVCVGKNLEDSSTIKNLDEVLDDDLILDIGPKTIKHIQDIIDKSKTILWNGPAGYFENTNFSKGSLEIAKKISKKNKLNEIFSVAGGGDTGASLNNFGLTNNFNFVSTAGGAFLEFLEGKELPGIKALNYYV